jgi:hypothetical protein
MTKIHFLGKGESQDLIKNGGKREMSGNMKSRIDLITLVFWI